MARALVIGGTLFMGRALVERLLERGDEVVIMHRGARTPFGERVGEIRCNRNDVAAVQRALAGGRFDVAYDFVYDWERGTTAGAVAAAARALGGGLRRYVFTSSVAAYGEGGPFEETAALVPGDDPNDYARNKAESERALFALEGGGGPAVSTLRPGYVYGPNNPFDREAFFWDRIRAGQPVIIPDDGTATMQWVHAGDVAKAAVLAGDADIASGRAYNVGSEPLSQVEFVRALAAAAQREVTLVHVPRATLRAAGGGVFSPPFYFGIALDMPPITMACRRVRTELGLQLTSLSEGLRETFLWYERQSRPTPDFSWENGVIATAG